MYEMAPPHSVEAEQAVVGGLMQEPAAWSVVSNLCRKEDFYVREHRLIFAAIEQLAERQDPVDYFLVHEQLQRMGHGDEVSLVLVLEIVKATYSLANIKVYAQIIHERASRRQIIAAAQSLSDAAHDNQNEFSAIIEMAEQHLGKAIESAPTGNPLAKRVRSKIETDSRAAIDRMKNQRWLIDEVIPSDAFGVVYGPSGGYKSFIVLDMSAAIATGRDWHGRSIDLPGTVLYIGAEGAVGLHLRKLAWQIRWQEEARNLAVLGQAITLTEKQETKALVDAAKDFQAFIGEPIRLVVIDTLARSFGGDENSASDMGAFIRACDQLRTELDGATVLVVHHSGKDNEKGARGSSALRAACDFELKVSPRGDKMTSLACTKAKDSEPFENMQFKLNPVEIGEKDHKGRDLTSLVLEVDHSAPALDEATQKVMNEGGPKKAILDLYLQVKLRQGGEISRVFLRDEYYHVMGGNTEAHRKAFSRGLAKLIEDEVLEETREGILVKTDPF